MPVPETREAVAEAATSPSPLAASSQVPSRFIPEIQGLRTVALVLVVLYHVWFQRVSGGVDVFLLVSAYLMTSSVLAATREGRPFHPVAYLVRRFGRLLPLAGTVIVLTLLALLAVFPVWRWSALLDDGWASLFYVENMLLQDRATNYYSTDLATQSPNQHFWSLSLQGQVFVLWALAHAVALSAARFTRVPLRGWLLLGFGAVFVVSLVFSVWMTDASQTRAYFDVRARLWEFALGSLLALVADLRMRRSVARMLTWIGIALIVTCGAVLPVGTTFPGLAALWPLGGAALVLLASSSASSSASAPRTVLAHPWLVTAGAYAYALYLTHWPILVATQTLTNQVQLGIVAGSGVLLASILVSVVLVHLVEKPLARFQRSGSLWRSAGVVVTILAIGVVAVAGLRPLAQARTAADAGSQARHDWAVLDEDCDPGVPLAEHCSATSSDDPDAPTVTFLGSSHMQQYTAAFLPTIEQQEWNAESFLLPGCEFRTAPGEGREQTCFQAWEAARDGTLLTDTDVLIILGSASTAEGDHELPGLEEFVEDVRATGTEVIAVRDNPRFTSDLFACGEQHGHDDPACRIVLEDSWADSFEVSGAVASVDLTTAICPGMVCEPVRDGQYVYLDHHHLTATFAASLHERVDGTLREVVPEAAS